MKTILVPTDFSEQSGHALDFALSLSDALNYQILLIHIIDLPPVIQTLYLDNYGMDDLNKEAKKQAEEKLKKILAQHNNERLHTAVFIGKVMNVLKEVEGEYDAQLVVMGTTGASGMKETIIGSNTEKVVRNIKTPVLAIPGPVKYADIKRIVIPTNGENSPQGFFHQIRTLQKMMDASLDVVFINALHAFENEEDVRGKLQKYCQEAQLEDCKIHVIRSVSQESGINDFVSDNKIDMVAVTTHGRQGLSHLMYGSLAENLVNHLKVPVYTYNMKMNS